MVGKVFSCSFTGLKCNIIEVQADIANGLPTFTIVGLGDTSVQESKERVRSSIKNSGAEFPQTRKTINLAPAQIKKQGSLFDLPIALSILLASNQINDEKIGDAIFIGELSLTGKIKRVNGVLPITQFAKEQGFKKIFLPKENALEASFIDEIEIYALEEFRDLLEYCMGTKELSTFQVPRDHHSIIPKEQSTQLLITSIIGLEKAKRGLGVAAAGGHNTMLYGSPGCGKTVLCRAFKSLLSEMTKSEMLQTTKIFSIAGLLSNENPLIQQRPFREVHHTASITSVIGGGTIPKPGEISLAHNGVLFLDEIAEFPKQILEALRQPLEDKSININRINSSLKFPCDFVLLSTMNPCPCGFKNDKAVSCICSEAQIQNYQKRLSGPIKDRFDIFIEVAKSNLEKIFENEDSSKQYEEILLAINNAISAQKSKFFHEAHVKNNASMNVDDIKKFCNLTPDAKTLLSQASKNLNLSNRGYLKVIKVAQTIADMKKSNTINSEHIGEAIQFRSMLK